MAVCSLTVLVFPRLPADLEVSTYTSRHVESDACLAVYHFSWVRCGGVGRGWSSIDIQPGTGKRDAIMTSVSAHIRSSEGYGSRNSDTGKSFLDRRLSENKNDP